MWQCTPVIPTGGGDRKISSLRQSQQDPISETKYKMKGLRVRLKE
jgi:hypothetical protein